MNQISERLMSWLRASGNAAIRWGGERPGRRLTSLLVLVALLWGQGAWLGQTLHAETAGASAPEVAKFEPVDTTDMVNLASGEFTYNIPIINVPGPEGGYPLALAYHANPLHAEEATWVGLGWNLQAGSIARDIRGYPDDYNGKSIASRYLTSSTKVDDVGVSIPTKYGIVECGFTRVQGAGTGGYVGFTHYSGAGFTVGRTVDGVEYLGGSYGWKWGPEGNESRFSVGITAYADGNFDISARYGTVKYYNSVGLNYSSRNGLAVNAASGGARASYNRDGLSVGLNTAILTDTSSGADGPNYMGIMMDHVISAVAKNGGIARSSAGLTEGGQKFHESGWNVGLAHHETTYYWVDKQEQETAYGYWYQDKNLKGDNNGVNEWIMESDPVMDKYNKGLAKLPTGYHYASSHDNYTVMGQGTGGSVRPTRLIDAVSFPRRTVDQWYEGMVFPQVWKGSMAGNARARFVFMGDNSEILDPEDYLSEPLGATGIQRDAFGNLTSGTIKSALDDVLRGLTTPVALVNLTSDPAANQSLFLGKTFQPRAPRRVEPLVGGFGLFEGFKVTETDGKLYEYLESALVLRTNTYSTSKRGHATGYSANDDWIDRSMNNPNPYAYAWYLSALKYPDYLDADQNGLPSEGDRGGWVNFTYKLGAANYGWTTSWSGEYNDPGVLRTEQIGGGKSSGATYSKSDGRKQLKYLRTIETATHMAYFATSPRLDGGEKSPGTFPTATIVPVGSGEYSITFTRDLGVSNDMGYREAITYSECNMVVGDGNYNTYTVDNTHFSPPTGADGSSCSTPYESDQITDFTPSSGKKSMITLDGLPVVISAIKRTRKVVGSAPGIVSTVNIGGSSSMKVCSTTGVGSYGHTDTLTVRFRTADQDFSRAMTLSTPSGQVDMWKVEKGIFNVMVAKGMASLTGKMMKLDDIYLIEKSTNTLIKQVHFTYDYSLCPGYSNSQADPVLNPNQGKLTLLSVQQFGVGGMPVDANNSLNPDKNIQAAYGLPPWRFTYQKNSPYVRPQAFDRWGMHKSDGDYMNHRDPDTVHGLGAWCMSRVTLPTGGNVEVEYEPKRYCMVQDKFVNNKLGPCNVRGTANVNTWLSEAGLVVNGVLTWPASQADRQKLTNTPFNLVYPVGGTTTNSASGDRDTLLVTMSSGGNVFRKQAVQVQVQSRDFLNGYGRPKRVVIDDPDFEMPAYYLQTPSNPPIDTVTADFSAVSEKIGGGVRVKELRCTTGARTYTTQYGYTMRVPANGTYQLLDSGVAASEPPPFGNEADDDRVIMTERGGWSNEAGGGIMYRQVTLRRTKASTGVKGPAGSNAGLTDTFLGETVFRFLSPADLPHRQKTVDNVVGNDNVRANGIRLTEVFNMGQWWGKPLWQENRSQSGRVLNRVEHDYSQLRAYLKFFPGDSSRAFGVDYDWDAKRGIIPNRPDMSYRWGLDAVPSVLQPTEASAASHAYLNPENRYLNTMVNITAWENYYNHMDVNNGCFIVREVSIPPVGRETRSYQANLIPFPTSGVNTYSKPVPSAVQRNTQWDGNTGGVVESWTRGQTLSGGSKPSYGGYGVGVPELAAWYYNSEWLVTRQWPAYWFKSSYQGMADKNMLTQIAQITSLRKLGESASAKEIFLNSKVQTWWQPSGNPGWFPGGEYVWNGRMAAGASVPPAFTNFGIWMNVNGAKYDIPGGLQEFKSQNWLFAGGVTAYDAFGHATEAVDGDGLFGCSKYGYPYDNTGTWNLAPPPGAASGLNLVAGTAPIVKFGNARDGETLYWNFEGPSKASNMNTMPKGNSASQDPDPIRRLEKAYSGERAYNGTCTIPVPAASAAMQLADGTKPFEVRYFRLGPLAKDVTAAQKSSAFGAIAANAGATLISVTPCEVVPTLGQQWWLVRLRTTASSVSVSGLVDDVAVFPWRRNNAPSAVSHFSYDRALGLVTSITGANGRTQRFRYDNLGRLATVYDAYGKPMAATAYRNAGF